MTAIIKKDGIELSCNGVKFLKAQATLSSLLGSQCKIGHGTLTVPLNCADVVLEQFPNISNPELRQLNAPIADHRRAVHSANAEFLAADTHRIPTRWIETLDVPQQYAVNAMVHPSLRGACLFDEQGTGKTVMTIAAFDILYSAKEVDKLMVVAPKSMLGGWEKDFNTFTPNKYSIGIVEGSTGEKRAVVDSGTNVLVVNYEGISSVLVLLKATAKAARTMLVVDESYYAKNPDALRSSLLRDLRPVCTRGYVLCGTPAPRTPYDLINQVNLADGGIAFAGFTKGSSEDADRERIKDIVCSRAVMIRRLKKDVLPNLPEKDFRIVTIKMHDHQREMYDKARDSLLVELHSLDNRTFRKWLTSYFQRRTTLLEICAVPRMVDPLFPKHSAKLDKLIEITNELLSQNRKVLIWTCYRASVEEIRDAFASKSPLVIDGSVTSGVERARIVDAFQNNRENMILIANPAAAGAGLTLHASHDAIYYSYTNQAAHYLQSLDRIHRRGQIANKVTYYMLICEDSIEEHEVQRLRQRELSQHDLLGDNVPWPESLDQALAELKPSQRTTL